jgi:hypothetical protein
MQVLELVQRIRPLLAGQHPSVQGTALAALTDIWLSGYVVLGDAAETQELRKRLLEQHMKCIWDLLGVDGHHAE